MSLANSLPDNLKRYADLVINSGCNIQPGQELLISIAIDCVDFARQLTASAYQRGARRVTVRFADEKITRLHYENCALEVFEVFPEWQALLNNSMAEQGAAVLNIISEDPQALAGIDQMKLVAGARAAHESCKPFYRAMDTGSLVWCIAGAGAPAWAAQVFPGLPADEATDRLWQAIFQTVRLDSSDPQAAWEVHRQSFDARKDWLNQQRFVSLHYSNSLGTDLTVGLNHNGIWHGGGDITAQGTAFFPNMPTEEIYTTPNRLQADGIVKSSMPLVHHGSMIKDFAMTFKDGKVASCQARVGQDVLESIFKVDEDAGRLGEVALVPWTSPIRASGLLFYNTLYDENASCHLAVGQGFPTCLEGGTELDEDQLKAAGVNKSATHVDFMIGTNDLSIVGSRADGSTSAVFENGEWAF